MAEHCVDGRRHLVRPRVSPAELELPELSCVSAMLTQCLLCRCGVIASAIEYGAADRYVVTYGERLRAAATFVSCPAVQAFGRHLAVPLRQA